VSYRKTAQEATQNVTDMPDCNFTKALQEKGSERHKAAHYPVLNGNQAGCFSSATTTTFK